MAESAAGAAVAQRNNETEDGGSMKDKCRICGSKETELPADMPPGFWICSRECLALAEHFWTGQGMRNVRGDRQKEAIMVATSKSPMKVKSTKHQMDALNVNGYTPLMSWLSWSLPDRVFHAKGRKMKKPDESGEERAKRQNAEAHKYNCETLVWEDALYVAPEFAAYIYDVLNALPPDVTAKLMDLKVRFLAAEENLLGLKLELPSSNHAYPNSDSHDRFFTHPGGKLLYFSPLLFEKSQEQILFTIAHEIAHAVLDTDDFSPREEGEADKMAEQWGFKRPPTVRDV